MPTYLCHGFRWHRRSIRTFVIVHDLDDAAPDWVAGRTTAAAILDQIGTAFDFLPRRPLAALAPVADKPPGGDGPDKSTATAAAAAAAAIAEPHPWPVALLEEYDVDETASAARPHAYVADHVVAVRLGAALADEEAHYQRLARERGGHGWFDRLRQELQPDEDMQWYVVVCADVERAAPALAESEPESGSGSSSESDGDGGGGGGGIVWEHDAQAGQNKDV